MMSTRINVTLDNNSLKDQAQKVYKGMGMSLSTAINVFLKQSVKENRMPFLPSNHVHVTTNDELHQIVNQINQGYKGERHHLIEK